MINIKPSRMTVAVISLFLPVMFACKRQSVEPVCSLADTWVAYDNFNNVYLDSAKYIYKNTNRDTAAVDRWNGAAAIWC